MAKPVASFNFTPNGLSVSFADRSSGIPSSWAWDFGFQIASVEQTSSLQNPGPIVFPLTGVYNISLTVTNADGSDTKIFPLVLSTAPSINLTIQGMVQYDLPSGITYDSIGFSQSIRKWQLWLQPSANIQDSDVFDESKWPPLWNVLISKCIEYDLILKAAASSMSAFIAANEALSAISNQVTSSTQQVADYTRAVSPAYPFVVVLIIINGVSYGPSPALPDTQSILNWLNALSKGTFAFSGGNLISLANSNILTTFNYTSNGAGTNTAFTQSNVRVVEIIGTSTSSSGGATGLGKGPLKSLETGPSKAAWYDSSVFWTNMFKTTGNVGNGASAGSGIIGTIQGEICAYGSRLKVQMPGCPEAFSDTPLFKIARRPGRTQVNPWPASKGAPPQVCPPTDWENKTW